MKKVLSILLLVTCVATLLVGCGQTSAPASSTAQTNNEGEAKQIVIGLAEYSMNEFDSSFASLFTEKAEALGVKVIVTNAEAKPEKQISDVDTLIAQQPDVIIIKPVDNEASIPSQEAVVAAGIPLIVMDGSLAEGLEGTELIADQGFNGQLLGEYLNAWLAEDSGRVANVGYIVGQYSEIVMPRKDEIFKTCPDAVLVAEADGSWNADQGMAITEDWLMTYPEMNVIAAMNDEMAIGAIQALTAAGKDMDEFIVLGVDGTVNGQQYIRSGELDATTYISVKEYVDQTLEAAMALANGESYDKPLSASVVALMTKDTIDELVG